nr:hypothetical protein [Pseudarthrobacter psychrotolerans]
MRRSTGWLKHHRLLAFFVVTYAISWASWPAYASGLIPRMEFLPIGPLAAAIVVIAVAEGRPGFRDWGRRLVRWRVGWAWYAVALLLPLVFVTLTGLINMALGASAPSLAQLTWSGLLTVFAVRLVNPLDGPLGEEPGSAATPSRCFRRPVLRFCPQLFSASSWPSGTCRWSSLAG